MQEFFFLQSHAFFDLRNHCCSLAVALVTWILFKLLKELLQSEKVIQVLRAHQQKVKQDKIKEIQERKLKKEQEPPENTDEGKVWTSCHVILALKETALCRFILFYFISFAIYNIYNMLN